MSYDVYIHNGSEELFWRNYTSNCSKLFYEHLDTENGIKAIHNKTGAEAAKIIAPFWAKLNEERHKLYVQNVAGEPKLSAKYDSPIGWGSLIGALIFIGEIQGACALYPESIIQVST